jgi:hypothetical protein
MQQQQHAPPPAPQGANPSGYPPAESAVASSKQATHPYAANAQESHPATGVKAESTAPQPDSASNAGGREHHGKPAPASAGLDESSSTLAVAGSEPNLVQGKPGGDAEESASRPARPREEEEHGMQEDAARREKRAKVEEPASASAVEEPKVVAPEPPAAVDSASKPEKAEPAVESKTSPVGGESSKPVRFFPLNASRSVSSRMENPNQTFFFFFFFFLSRFVIRWRRLVPNERERERDCTIVVPCVKTPERKVYRKRKKSAPFFFFGWFFSSRGADCRVTFIPASLRSSIRHVCIAILRRKTERNVKTRK